MKTKEYNKGVSFEVPDATFDYLCRAVSTVSGVVFTKRRRFFWSWVDVGAEFTFRGHAFQIEADSWDGALWVLAKDMQKHEVEMQELRDAVERFEIPSWSVLGFFRRILLDKFS